MQDRTTQECETQERQKLMGATLDAECPRSIVKVYTVELPVHTLGELR